MEAIDFNSQDFINDPYPVYRRLRESGEPYWLAHAQTNSQSPGIWLVSRYADVAETLRSAKISKQLSRVRLPENLLPVETSMLNQDPPEHSRLRSLVSQSFTPDNIRKLAPRIEKIVGDLTAGIAANGGGDFVADFAIPLPMMVIADFMGVPFEDHRLFCRWTAEILRGYDSGVANTDNFYGYKTAIADMADYFERLIEQRRRNLSADLISELIEARDKHERLNARELISMCMLFLVAGHETTTNLLSVGLLTLLRHPDQFALLKESPHHMASAIEEMLRFESPVQRATFRITSEACTIGGKQFGAGEQLCAMIGSANRDPSQFDRPDSFDITRTPNRHLTFGFGIHFCLGAVLARMEAQTAFKNIIERLPPLRMADPPQWNEKKLFRGLRTLPLAM